MKATSTKKLLVSTGRFAKSYGIAALSVLAMNALAAEPPTHENYREMQQKISFIDMKVHDNQGQYIGKVTDLALDLENGRIVEVLVSSGGFLGMFQRTVAVPPGALRFEVLGGALEPRGFLQEMPFNFEARDGVLRLNRDMKQFKAAPVFTVSKWAEHCQSQHVMELYRYYGQEPYFAADGQSSPTGNTATEPLGYVQRSSKLVGLPVKNLQEQPLGSVFTFLFSSLGGRAVISHVIVMTTGYTYSWSVIPSRALRFNAARDALYLDVSTQAFKDEPRFKLKVCCDPFELYTRDNQDAGKFKQETYANTEVAQNDGINTRQNVREGSANTYAPLAQGTSFRDVDKTHRIYQAMLSDESLSRDAQNIEVGTLNGRTTLRGHVNSEAAKRSIGEIAAKAGLPENVSNLLEVRTLAIK